MLKAHIRKICMDGEGCSRILLRAAAEEYGFSLPPELLDACSGINGGFGIDGLCSGLVAGVMVLGLLFEEDEVKGRRILFLLRAQERFGALDCCCLSAAFQGDCCGLLEEIAEILQEIIEGEEFGNTDSFR